MLQFKIKYMELKVDTIRLFIKPQKKKRGSKFNKNLQLDREKENPTKPSIHFSKQSPTVAYLLRPDPIQLVSCK